MKAADRLYSQETVLNLISFSDYKLAALAREISKLFLLLGDQKELSIWPTTITALKKVRFELATLPIPPRKIITDSLKKQLADVLSTCHDSFPDNLEQISHIIELLNDYQEQDNLFISWIQAKCMEEATRETCICLLYSKFVHPVEDFINTHVDIPRLRLRILSPGALKNFTFYDRIFFCGSIKLFSENNFRNLEHVWRSPRAPELYFLSFNWIRDDFEPRPTFDISCNRVPTRIQKLRVSGFDEGKENIFEKNVQAKLDISNINFSPVEMIQTGSSSTAPGSCEAICDCRLHILEDETFIYLELERPSRIVEFSPQAKIYKIPNNQLEAGMPLVVRTEGSGDSIAAVADLLFGGKAEGIRNKQGKWKIAFRRKLFTYSTVHEVAEVLINLGAPTSNETNVRNWQRNDTIKPKKYDDFRAIMVFSGLVDKTREYWDNAKQIDLMHKKAGREISKLLLSRINESSRTDLEKYGRIDVVVSGLSGKVSVIRIDSILPEIHRIPSSELNRVLHYWEIKKWRE